MSDLIEALAAITDEGGLIHGERLKERRFPGDEPLALVRPKTTEEVSAILRLCNERGQAVVPMGGMTGLVEGTKSNNREIVISLERMNAIEEIDV